MTNPYTGLNSTELAKHRTFLLAVLNGESMESFGGQGSNFKRRIPTLEEARQDLALVQAALDALTASTKPVTRTQGAHSTYQMK
jgi:hypothetical protein